MPHGKDRTLWELTRGGRLRFASAILCMWLAIGFTFCVPLVSMVALDALAGDADAAPPALAALSEGWADESEPGEILLVAALLTVLLTAIAGAFHFLRGRLAAQASESIVRRVRERMYAHLQRLPCNYHDGADTGDLVQRCTSDVETVRVFLSGQVVEIGRAVLLFTTVIVVMLLLDLRMTLYSVSLFPVIVLFAFAFFRLIKGRFLDSDRAEGRMTTVLQENLTGIRVVRAFARQEFECARFAEANGRFRDLTERWIRTLGTYWSLSDLFCLAQVGLGLVGGAHELASGRISIGTFYAFLTLQGIVIWPVRHMGRVLADTGKAVVALGRLQEILATPEESRSPTDEAGEAVPAVAGELRFDGVRFAYGAAEECLRGLDLHMGAGETVALLGPPGSGKSTIVQLLARLYDYDIGSIRLDGRELSGLDRDFVRSQVGIVLQQPFLYSKTIRENLAVGRPDAEDVELERAAQDACIHDSIAELDDGYGTLVGERGVTLSGGQRQRVALARALLKDPPILVLDDALSAVDTHTEASIVERLRLRRGRRTTILIAHRLSTIRHADRVFVLDGGRVVQAGSHAELVREEGPYLRLWRIQGAIDEELARDLGPKEIKETAS